MKYLVGIDEVGRGAIAGPIFVCAAAIPLNFKIKNKHLGKLLDSKKLSQTKRLEWFNYFINLNKIKFRISKVLPSKIDKINISNSANLAAWRAFKNLIISQNDFVISKIFLDGGLYLKSKNFQKLNFSRAYTVIKGDEKYDVVKIASIIAKVKRDKYMDNLAKKYPYYFFEKNKGYGTKIHLDLIKKYGPILEHRLTFL
ncbi:MAG: ribonuclease HII [bacterium]|nr:ribonuclease HII [Patescibacteria group bacterium]MDW8279993.1 ribonuclease HII [bacterium]